MLSSISYKRCYAEFCVGKISHYTYWRLTATVRRGFNMVLFTERSKHLCRRYMRSIPSALLVKNLLGQCEDSLLFVPTVDQKGCSTFTAFPMAWHAKPITFQAQRPKIKVTVLHRVHSQNTLCGPNCKFDLGGCCT